MIPSTTIDPIMRRATAELRNIYSDRLDRIVLFGSRARGDASPESDYDVAVFLTEMPDRWQEIDRLSMLSLRIADDTGAIVNTLPYLASAYTEQTPLMASIRSEGVSL